MSTYSYGMGLKLPPSPVMGPQGNQMYRKTETGHGNYRMQNAGRHWTVDVGQIVADQAENPMITESNILYQSRAHASQAYGVSSHRDYVNYSFRPPVQVQEDLLPLTRIPRGNVSVKVNPGSETVLPINNSTEHDVKKYIEDRVETGQVRPTFFREIHFKLEDNVTRELFVKLAPNGTTFNDGFKLPQISADAGINPPMTVDGEINRDIDLHEKIPIISVETGKEIPIFFPTEGRDYDLAEKFNPRLDVRPQAPEGADFIDYTPVAPPRLNEKAMIVAVEAPKTYQYRTQETHNPTVVRSKVAAGNGSFVIETGIRPV